MIKIKQLWKKVKGGVARMLFVDGFLRLMSDNKSRIVLGFTSCGFFIGTLVASLFDKPLKGGSYDEQTEEGI